MPSRLEIIAIDGIPDVVEGDDVAVLIADAFFALGETPHDGDIIAIAQKIISKAEGAIVGLADIAPTVPHIPSNPQLACKRCRQPEYADPDPWERLVQDVADGAVYCAWCADELSRICHNQPAVIR